MSSTYYIVSRCSYVTDVWHIKYMFCTGCLCFTIYLCKVYNLDLYTSSYIIIRVIRSRRMRWVGHVVHMEEMRSSYKILGGRPEGKRPIGRPRHRWEDNIEMNLWERLYKFMNKTELVQDRVKWQASVSIVMDIRVP